MRYHLAARGWNLASAAGLVATVIGAWILAGISVELRSFEDGAAAVEVLDRLVLVGIVLPVAVVVRQLEDRAAWLFATGARGRIVERGRYFGALVLAAVALGCVLAQVTAAPGFWVLVLADYVLLLALGSLGAVVLGAGLSWLPPVAVAVAFSTPGLIPIDANLLVRPAAAGQVALGAGMLLVVAAVAFCGFDDYGLSRARLRDRKAGVTEE